MEDLAPLSQHRLKRPRGDVVPYASLGMDEFTLLELVIGVDDGIGGYLQQHGHISYRRDTVALREAPCEDPFADIVNDVGEAYVDISHVIYLSWIVLIR